MWAVLSAGVPTKSNYSTLETPHWFAELGTSSLWYTSVTHVLLRLLSNNHRYVFLEILYFAHSQDLCQPAWMTLYLPAPSLSASRQLPHSRVLNLSSRAEAVSGDAVGALCACGGVRNLRTFSVSLGGKPWPRRLDGEDQDDWSWLTIEPCLSNSAWQSLCVFSLFWHLKLGLLLEHYQNNCTMWWCPFSTYAIWLKLVLELAVIFLLSINLSVSWFILLFSAYKIYIKQRKATEQSQSVLYYRKCKVYRMRETIQRPPSRVWFPDFGYRFSMPLLFSLLKNLSVLGGNLHLLSSWQQFSISIF